MNVASLLIGTVNRYPNHTALVFGSRRWTYAEWFARAGRLAASLSELGVRPTDRVAFYVSTSEPSVTTYFACQLLGAVAVPINYRLAPGEVAGILRDSGARVLVYGSQLMENALQVAAQIRTVHDYISAAETSKHLPAGHHLFEALAEKSPAAPVELPDIGPNQISALVYTSGTTGRPKGVVHTHANDVAIATNCVMEYRLSHADKALHIAPLYHVGGMQAYFIPHLMVGGTNVVLGRYEAEKTLETIVSERITSLFAVPTQIQEMLFHPAFPKHDMSSLRMITTGGAAISAATMERVIREFCPRIYNGYGMTEASLTLLLHPPDALSHLGSCGKPTLISECRIVKETQTPGGEIHLTEAAANEVGELLVRGQQMTPGYWNNPTETHKKIRLGWLHTGDLFSKDADGFFNFHGRADDMIVSGGENIYPREVEEVLYRCPGIKEAAVVGLPDAKWGHAVTAFVVRSDPGLMPEAIDAFCKRSDDLAPYKRPRKIVFLDALPTNASGKVLKRELLARAA